MSRNKNVLAVDFESPYSDTVTIKNQGTVNYTLDPWAHAYMVSLAGSDGLIWVGKPEDADWAYLVDKYPTWISHNAGFDHILYRNQKFGPEPKLWECSADLAAYCGLPRSLAGACEVQFGIKPDKSVRDNMKGKTPADLTEEQYAALVAYAKADAELCLKLWNELSPKWPKNERLISRLSRQAGWEGVPVNPQKIADAKETLKQHIWNAERNIPWDAPKLSPKNLALKCREVGIPCPKSLAMDSEECAAWEEEYGEKYPWVDGMRNYRRANMLLKKIEAMEKRIKPDGRMAYEVMYWGAHTGRWTSSSGLNVHNMSSKDMFGVSLRGIIEASAGKTLVISDLSQIEPRCLAFLCGNHNALKQMAAGVSPYVIHARETMGLGPNEVWEKNDLRYKVSKIRSLGLGFGCGHHKFLTIGILWGVGEAFEVPITEEHRESYLFYLQQINKKEWSDFYEQSDEMQKIRLINSWLIVTDFREKSPLLVGLWNKIGVALKASASRGEDLEISLPSGRTMVYRKCRYGYDPESRQTQIVCDSVRNGRVTTTRIYAGLILENLTQGFARDVFSECWVRVYESGRPPILQVHDELVCEVPEEKAEEATKDIERLMSISPDWCPFLPVAAEAHHSKIYTK